MRTIRSDNRKSGIALIGDLPWGTHICQFYQTKEDLLEILVPYFKAGLENNELCIWVTSAPLSAKDVKMAMNNAFPHFEKYREKGQMEIVPHGRWQAGYGKSGTAMVQRLDQAILDGFDGLRLACNVATEKKRDKVLALDEETAVISRYNVIAVFTYPRDEFDAIGLMGVVKNHRFALVSNAGRWEVIESSEATIAKDALRRSEEKLQSLFSNMAEGFAYHRIVLGDSGKPCDYLFLEVNDAFEKLTGLKGENIIGKRVTEVLPGIEKDPADWIGKYGRVALTGEPVRFESYAEPLKVWYSISAFSPHKGYFAVAFSDITARKKAEETLRESEQRWATTLASIGDGVIATDVEGRITFMNAVAESLTGWTLVQASGKPVAKVFNIVNEQSRREVENPVTKVLREGKVVGLANHTVLIRKDGTEVAVSDSGAPIRDKDGKNMGVVLVFRDITERRRAEKALKKAHDELEIRVRERTSELSEAVERLHVENIQRKELEDILRQSESQVRFFAAQCLTAQETERKRVAGELHDSVTASLAAMRFRIEKVAEEMKEGKGSLESLQHLGSNVTEITREVRRIMADLRPSVLDDLGIIAAVNWFCREYQKTYFHLSVENEIAVSEEDVPDSLKTPIFRICQEAMNNAAKYGKGSLVNLALRMEDEKILLTIRDNGQGFDPETAGKGLGLSQMRERAQLSGGSFALESVIGKGTTIRASWSI